MTSSSLISSEGLKYPPPIRLVNGSSETEGHVQIFVRGRWGGICGNYYSWGNNDAMVVCRQLGLPADGAQALSYRYREASEERMIIGDVYCTGREAYISDCPNDGLYVSNCGYYYDYGQLHAGVRCQGNSLY